MMYLIFLAIIGDGIILYFMPSYLNNLNYFYPMLTITLIPVLSLKYTNQEYFKKCFIIGFLYDLYYSSIFLFHALIFLLLGKINVKIQKIVPNNCLFLLILVIINIVIYDSLCFILVLITNYQKLTINSLFYKISHSLLLNIFVFFVYYFLLKKRKVQHKIKW